EKKPQGGGLPQLQQPVTDSGEQTPEQQLQQGHIPTDFLRLMFYTLGDYRDILFSGVKGEKNGYNDIFSGDKDIAEREKQIKDAIERVLKNGDSQPPSGTTPQQTWWQKNGEHIWNGMVCALTYDTDTASGTALEQIDAVKSALFGKDDKPKDNYQYTSVTIGASGTEAKTTGDDTPLTQFVVRPPYFRYLEEWGENFCKERKKRLRKIKEECRGGENGNRHSSGDGEDCTKIGTDENKTFRTFDYLTCARHCRSYKKWIERKKEEFVKQKEAYEQQKKNCEKESEGAKNKSDNTYDQEFVEKLRSVYTSIDSFLNRLKNGPCKNNDNDKTGNSHIKFDVNADTFKHTDLCNPCPIFGVNCKNGDCNNAEKKSCKENGKDFISAEDIKTMKESIDVDMRVSHNGENGFGDLSDCQNAGIFKSIRKDVWKCGKLCNSDVCFLENVDEKKHNQKNVTITALFKSWVDNFLEDYNKINGKISHCIDNGKGNICKNKCNDKCKCVGEWIKLKMAEWEKIRDRYLKPYEGDNTNMKYLVRTFLEELQHLTEFKNAIKPCNGLEQFEKSCGLNRTDSSQKSKNSNDNDLVQCLLKKLGEKAEKCQEHQNIVENQTTCGGNTPPDDEEPLEETEENTLDPPKICPEQPKQEVKEESGCEPPATTAPKEPTADGGEGTQEPPPPPEPPEEPPPLVPSTPAPGPLPPPPSPPPPPSVNPTLPADQPFDPTILQTTIPFGVALALGSIAFFFMK
ncbi:hypothetical protein PFMALIP_05791, partial [Plasmodium falciparum MaliPS096_E11]